MDKTDLGCKSGPIASSPCDLGQIIQPVSLVEELVKIREKVRSFHLTMRTWKKLNKS